MNGIQPLRFITRAILPLVYDESLSYYEFLCKVLDKLNIVITNSNTQSEAIKALNTELKNFEASTDAKFLEYQTNIENLFNEVEAKLNLKEDTANKTQIITDSATEAQYPSAKAVNEVIKALNAELNNKEDTANKTQIISDSATEAQYPSAKAVNEVIKALNTELNNKEDTANKTQIITDSATEAQYPSAKAVLEYMKAHAGGANVVSIDFPFGQETVGYDTTNGISITSQTQLTNENGEVHTVATDISLPIFSGAGISINAKADGTGVVVKNTSYGAPEYAQSVDELNSTGDKSKIYLLPDGYLYAWAESTSQETIKVSTSVNGTPENPYKDGYRLGRTGDTFQNDAAGYTVTPYIDLTPYSGKNINIILEGLTYFTETYTQWVQSRCYKDSSTVFVERAYSTPVSDTNSAFHGATNVSIDIQSSTKTVMTTGVPMFFGPEGNQVFGLRFCAQGSGAQSTITIEYDETHTVTKEQWTNTGIRYGSGETSTIASLNNEGADPTTISLLTSAVKEYYNKPDYNSDDYTYSYLNKITYPYRADIPVPYVVKWNYDENAMRTILAVCDSPITDLNPYKLTQYEVTGYNKYPIYNLLPSTTYYYRVSHILSNGDVVVAKSGSFTTDSTKLRLLYISGTQNVRDLGGWTGLNGKTVKYGKLIRGAALSDSSGTDMIVTGEGRFSLAGLKITGELNLGADGNETYIAANCIYKKVGYTNYAIAITEPERRAQFKEIIEWIVANPNKNIYFHCQGGCDRTGTLSFQILGLLGVSESDLAKDYELSSFSDVGLGRLRNTVKATDTYDYSGMVSAIKAYNGTTITDKFYNFAIDCGLSDTTISTFRNMLLI